MAVKLDSEQVVLMASKMVVMRVLFGVDTLVALKVARKVFFLVEMTAEWTARKSERLSELAFS